MIIVSGEQSIYTIETGARDDLTRRFVEKWEKWTWYGVRCCDDLLSVGDTVPNSRVWDDGEPTDEMLDGASCIKVAHDGIGPELFDMVSSYVGEHVYLIAGHYASYGEDDGEIIIRDAVVVDVIEVGR